MSVTDLNPPAFVKAQGHVVTGNEISLEDALLALDVAIAPGSQTITGDLQVDGDSNLDGTLDVAGVATFADDASIGGDASVDGSLTVTGAVLGTLTTPASADATGVAGTLAWDANYIYVCTATDTWKRVAIATWP